MASDINTDHSCSRAMEPNMNLGSSLDPDNVLALEGSPGHSNQDDSDGRATKPQIAFPTVSFFAPFDEHRPRPSTKTLTTGGPQI